MFVVVPVSVRSKDEVSDIKLRKGYSPAGSAAGLDGRFSCSLRLARIPMRDIRLDATESVKDITYGGRIDSLDLDVNGTPAILEYRHFIVRSSPADGSAVSIAAPPE